jgi:hypothetical protein
VVTTDFELIDTQVEEGTQQAPEDGMTVGELFENGRRFMRGLNMPAMRKPVGHESEYDFPTDVTVLRSPQLGALQLRLAAWYTYSLSIIGREESELGVFKEIFDVKVGAAMAVEKTRHDKLVAKEILRSICIQNVLELRKLHKAILARQHRVDLIKAQANVYHEQLVRLSREQSRRESEASVGRAY